MYRNPEETEEGMASISSKDASSSGVSLEPVRKDCHSAKVINSLVQKGVIHSLGSSGKLVNMGTLSIKPA